MIINVDKLRAVGVSITAKRNGKFADVKSVDALNGLVLEIYFEHGKFPQELHDAIYKLLPGQKIEADIIAEGTFRKVSDFQLLQAINENE
jgi:hypothetical protein